MIKFLKIFEKNKCIVPIEYTFEDQKNYFRFVESQHENGLRQVIITSKLMLKIIENFFLQEFSIKKIIFDEDDLELEDEIKKILEKITEDRVYFFKLFNKLECISNNSSINLQRIEMSGKFKTVYSSFLLQVNGILKIDGDVNLSNNICKIIQENINEN